MCLASKRAVATAIRRRWFIEVPTSPQSQTLLICCWSPWTVFVVCTWVRMCVCWRETTCTSLSPCLLLSASESGTRRKRPIIKKKTSLHLCSVGINHFFAFLFSFFPLLWLSDIPHPFPPSLKLPTPPRYSRSRTHASSLFWLKIATTLPGPSSAPYLIIYERKAGWGCLLDCLLLW